jgi:hypothetical protein
MLQTYILELASFLISNSKTDKLSEELYKYDRNILNISDYFNFQRNVYIASFDLDIYTLDLLDNMVDDVKESIKLREMESSEYVCFVNGPFFGGDSKPIGRRKSRFRTKDKIFDEYIPLNEKQTNQFPASVYTDINDRIIIESKIADDAAFENAKFFFEGTPLFIDVDNNVNNFRGDNISTVIEQLANSPTLRKGMPFLGIAEKDSRRYLIIIMLEHFSNPLHSLSYDYRTLFTWLSEITEKIGVKKMVFTDGSDSVFLKFENSFYNEDIGSVKNEKMPYFIGIRRKTP